MSGVTPEINLFHRLLWPEFHDSLVIKVDITALNVVNSKFPDTFLTMSQISFQFFLPKCFSWHLSCQTRIIRFARKFPGKWKLWPQDTCRACAQKRRVQKYAPVPPLYVFLLCGLVVRNLPAKDCSKYGHTVTSLLIEIVMLCTNYSIAEGTYRHQLSVFK